MHLTLLLYLRLIIFLVRGDVPVDSDALLMTDFMNLNIEDICSGSSRS
jgi:hypothetical protein